MGEDTSYDRDSARDRHLFEPGPKRILAFDGGGVRGIIAVAFLAQIEKFLAKKAGEKVPLCDAFDLIGGTSTGSIIATALALGKTTENLETIYHKLAPGVFVPDLYFPFVQSKFDAKKLREQIDAIVGGLTLETEKLKTGLAIIAKRADTASVWLISNSPRAPYWIKKTGRNFISNKDYKLATLIRASTAAPTYFDPEEIPIMEGGEKGLFVDGGMSPHNNPALALFMLSQLETYGIRWPTGADKLTIVSIGTGSYRKRLDTKTFNRMRMGNLAVTKHSLLTMMDDAQGLNLALMQWMGKTLTPWTINAEWRTLANDQVGGAPQFRFLRYDVRLEKDWLKENTGMTLTDTQLNGVRQMDDPDYIRLAYQIGAAAAKRQVLESHWIDNTDTVSKPL